MKFEFSAGGIVYKSQKSKIKNQKGSVSILVAQHSQHHGWVFPKGLINKISNIKYQISKRETKEEAALREVKEETGIDGKIIKPLPPIEYWYVLEGDPSTGHSTLRDKPSGSDSKSSGREKIKKTVYYFLMEYVSGDIKEHDFEMENVEWLPINEVENRLTYKSDKEVWKEAKELISNS